MSKYYSRIKGHRGQATRTGTLSSGITANATGWDIGGTVSINYSPQLQTDVVTFHLTKGSNGHTSRRIASFAITSAGLTLIDSVYPELFV